MENLSPFPASFPSTEAIALVYDIWKGTWDGENLDHSANVAWNVLGYAISKLTQIKAERPKFGDPSGISDKQVEDTFALLSGRVAPEKMAFGPAVYVVLAYVATRALDKIAN